MTSPSHMTVSVWPVIFTPTCWLAKMWGTEYFTVAISTW